MEPAGMPWWGEVILAGAGLVVLPTLAWIVIRIIGLGNEQVRLAGLIAGIEKNAQRIDTWTGDIDKKLDAVAMTQAEMLGHLRATASAALLVTRNAPPQ
jgi:hypothetical protein